MRTIIVIFLMKLIKYNKCRASTHRSAWEEDVGLFVFWLHWSGVIVIGFLGVFWVVWSVLKTVGATFLRKLKRTVKRRQTIEQKLKGGQEKGTL